MDEEARTEAAAPSASLLELPTPTFDKCYLYLNDWTGHQLFWKFEIWDSWKWYMIRMKDQIWKFKC